MAKREKHKVAQSKSKKNRKVETSYSIEMNSIIKISIVVIVVLILVYLFTLLVTGKINFGKESEESAETVIQYEEILVGEMFNQSENDYLVLFYEQGTTNESLYDTFLSMYETKTNALKYYKVNMANTINQMYVSEDSSNLYITKASEVKVKDDTLVHVTSGKVNAVYEGKAAISEYFTNFGK